MGDFPRYERYKNSGVEWLGEIPEHWEVKRVKHVTRKIIDGTHHTPTYTDDGIPFLRVTDISSKTRYINLKNIKRIAKKEHLELCKRVKAEKGDILLSKNGTIGLTKVVNWDFDFSFFVSLCLIKPRSELNPNYFCFFFDSSLVEEQLKFGSKQTSVINLHLDKIKELLIAFPPIEEQKRIANFLDRKTLEIENAIAKKQRLIELLEEQKTILINQAVTKSLNPNVKMKDSGIEWIGEIPEHWEVKRVKNIFELIIEPAPVDNNMELLSVYSDIGVKPRKELEERGNKASTTDGYWIVKKGDIIVNKLLAWMGAIGLSNYDGVTSPAYDILRAKIPICGEFFNYILRMPRCSSELKRHSRGIMEMRLRLYFDKFGIIEMPFPSIKEQKKIAVFLQKKEKELESIFLQIQKEITTLKELKQILISQAVTGKIKI